MVVREPARVPEVDVGRRGLRHGARADAARFRSPVNGTAWRRSRPASATWTRFAPTQATRAASLAIPVRRIRSNSSSAACSSGICGKWNSCSAVRLIERSERDHLAPVRAERGVRLRRDVLEPVDEVVEERPELGLEEVGRQPEVGLDDVEQLAEVLADVVDRELARRARRPSVRMSCAAASAASGPSTAPSSCALRHERGERRLERRRRRAGGRGRARCSACARNRRARGLAGGLEGLEDVAALERVDCDPDAELREVADPGVGGRRVREARQPLRLRQEGADAQSPIPTASASSPTAATAAPATSPRLIAGTAARICLYASLTLSSSCFSSSFSPLELVDDRVEHLARGRTRRAAASRRCRTPAARRR